MYGEIRILGHPDPDFYTSDDYNNEFKTEHDLYDQSKSRLLDESPYAQPPVSVSSHYWKIPDNRQYLSAIAAHETDPLVAIASGSKESNLFIYELGRNETDASKSILTHHQTITLGEIHSLAWASPNEPLGRQGNIIFTGHNTGTVHMILLPDPYKSNDPAEIMKRFNHNRHVDGAVSTRISQLGLTGKSWSCCAPTSVMSLFSEHLFLWDPSRSDKPIMKRKTRGVCCFDISQLHDGIISLGGTKGISIRDIREKGSSGLSPPNENDTKVTQVKWSPFNSNLVAAVHDSNVLKVWDVRANSPMLTFNGHSDVINSVHWSKTDSNQLWSASNDSTVRMWDINESKERLKEEKEKLKSKTVPLDSRKYDAKWVPTKPWKLYRQRLSRYDESYSLGYFIDPIQGGTLSSTTVFSESKQFLSLASLNNQNSTTDQGILSIDNDGFFGLHVREGLRESRDSFEGYNESFDFSSDGSDTDYSNSYSPPR